MNDSYTMSILTLSNPTMQRTNLFDMDARKKGQRKARTDSENELLRKFGENVRTFRGKLDIAQDELAFRSGIHRTYIGAVERGEYNITLINICRLAKHLDCDPVELLENIKLEQGD